MLNFFRVLEPAHCLPTSVSTYCPRGTLFHLTLSWLPDVAHHREPARTNSNYADTVCRGIAGQWWYDKGARNCRRPNSGIWGSTTIERIHEHIVALVAQGNPSRTRSCWPWGTPPL